MDDQKFKLILEKIMERTKEGKLEWKTTANRNTFLTVLQDSSISVSYETERIEDFIGNEDIYIFDFRNENGEIVESIIVTRHNKAGESVEEFEKAEIIYKIARNQSLKVDKTVDRILEQLAA